HSRSWSGRVVSVSTMPGRGRCTAMNSTACSPLIATHADWTAGAASREGTPLNRRRRRVVVLLLILFVALPIVGSLYEMVAEVRDANVAPPPGIRVDIGGRRLHL